MGFGDTPMRQIRVYEFAKNDFVTCDIFICVCDILSVYVTKICHILNQLTSLSLYKYPKLSNLYLILHIYA